METIHYDTKRYISARRDQSIFLLVLLKFLIRLELPTRKTSGRRRRRWQGGSSRPLLCRGGSPGCPENRRGACRTPAAVHRCRKTVREWKKCAIFHFPVAGARKSGKQFLSCRWSHMMESQKRKGDFSRSSTVSTNYITWQYPKNIETFGPERLWSAEAGFEECIQKLKGAVLLMTNAGFHIFGSSSLPKVKHKCFASE